MTSSFCSAVNCLQVAFTKSSKSNPSGNSVEARISDDQRFAFVRDSKLGAASPILRYPLIEWHAGRRIEFTSVYSTDVPDFIMGIRAADVMVPQAMDWYKVEKDGQTLFFDQEEVTAFQAGVQLNEFASA
jgi:hypothetical protein